MAATPWQSLLQRMQLGEYYEALVHAHGLEACDVPHVNDQDLRDAGMAKPFHRKRFLRHAVGVGAELPRARLDDVAAAPATPGAVAFVVGLAWAALADCAPVPVRSAADFCRGPPSEAQPRRRSRTRLSLLPKPRCVPCGRATRAAWTRGRWLRAGSGSSRGDACSAGRACSPSIRILQPRSKRRGGKQ